MRGGGVPGRGTKAGWDEGRAGVRGGCVPGLGAGLDEERRRARTWGGGGAGLEAEARLDKGLRRAGTWC
jgi:hypothetical protein